MHGIASPPNVATMPLQTAQPPPLSRAIHHQPSTVHLHLIDSHTAGEPTRVVVGGVPDLEGETLAEKLAFLQTKHDWLRRSIILEPRGSDVMVGALLLPAQYSENHCGVIFFNNVGYLKMCGHGTMGVIETLRHLGRLTPGDVNIETPVGVVTARLLEDGRIRLRNVPSYRLGEVQLDVPGFHRVYADIAWGGNWFLLIENHGLEITLANAPRLMAFSREALAAARAAGCRGDDGREIDHVELFGPAAPGSEAHSKNFVLCPGGVYDRSPCGTGTSAKLACLFSKGLLQPGAAWRQAGILDTEFEGKVSIENGMIIPTITGRAFVNGEARILFDPADPFRNGISP